ncbi:MAG: class I SAM-dependent methyltransferase, partial [Pseudonocardia sp.]|nr:class I SAM-dependent methyltransferase [Pseudonocardia sp.]
VLGAMSGAAPTAMIVVGGRLGLYATLAEHGAATSAELALASGTSERYAREWLAQQAAAGVLEHDAGTGRFTLPAEHAAVLADERSPAFLAGGAVITAGWFHGVEQLVEAFRTGAGIPWSAQHPAVFEGTERFFAPGYAASLTTSWIPALDGVDAALRAGGTVADVGCGHGASTIMLAAAYPAATVLGYDAHPASIEVARKRAAAAGVADRARFEVADAAGYPASGYDLVCLLDTLHDLGDPDTAAAHAHRALRPGGSVLVVEPQAADSLAENLANPLAALSYAASTFQCTPASLAQPGRAAWGAQAGERPVRAALEAAGFREFRRVADTPANAVYAARR